MRFPRIVLLSLCAALFVVSCSENDEDEAEDLAPDVGVISQIQTASFAMDACARGTELYVAENSDWVNVYDISDPANPF